jgi:ATP-dependent DNA helicase PIF1
VIAVGDFFQLPPVPDRDTINKPLKFAFEAAGWRKTFTEEVDLKEVYRQKDPAFVSVLDEMRYGRLSKKNAALLASLHRPIVYEDGIAPTEL